MKISDKRAKLLFAAFAASLLIIILPLNTSAQTNVGSVSEASTTVSNLYKYLYHVNVTQYPWTQGGWGPANRNFNPDSPAPSTNHLLWVSKVRPYEALSTGNTRITNGKVIVATSSSQSIYGDAGLYAFDQNTGQIIWSYPGLSSAIVIDEQHMLCGTTMINPDTGQFLYTVPRSLMGYDPISKMGFGSGPSPGRSASTIMGWDFSDVENPQAAWTSEPQEIANWAILDNGKVFYGGRDQYNLVAADARNGKVLWDVTIPDYITAAAADNDKIFLSGWTGGLCYDQNTGDFLWRMPSHNREFGTGAVAYGKVYVHEANYGLYALDMETGGIVWRYIAERAAPFPHGQDVTVGAKVTTDQSQSPTVADGKVYFLALDATRYGGLLPAKWMSADGTMWNPYNYEVLGQVGTAELVCLDAESGKLIWKSGVEEIGSPGPEVQEQMVADGKVYGAQRTYTGHVGVPDARPYTELELKQLINYEWYPPRVFCWGQGPTQFKDLAVSQSQVKFGENVTVTGKLVDLSPPIKDLSILSNYKRDIASPATKVPVVLSFISSNGTAVPFATVNTDNDGMFSATWYPWETGSLQIVVESAGSEAYEAPDTMYTAVSVTPVTPDLVPLLEGALAVAIIIAVALPVIVYIRKPKQ